MSELVNHPPAGNIQEENDLADYTGEGHNTVRKPRGDRCRRAAIFVGAIIVAGTIFGIKSCATNPPQTAAFSAIDEGSNGVDDNFLPLARR